MERQRTAAIIVGACLLVGVGVGLEHARLAWETPAAPPVESISERPVLLASPVRTITVTNDLQARADNEVLRRRIAELEQALSTRKASGVQATASSERSPENVRSRRSSFAERMAQLKTTDPARYAELQQRREAYRQVMAERAQAQADFLAAIDVRDMAEEQRANHEKLVETVALVDELRAQMEQADSSETRDQMRQQLGEAMAALGELYGAERQYLFEETARAVGYEGSQVYEFADQIQTIIDNTAMPHFRRHGW